MLGNVLFFLDNALITVPIVGIILFAFLKYRGIPQNKNLILSFGVLPFPLLLATYVLSALIVNGPHGRFDFLRYVELCVQAYPFHVALFGVAVIMLRRQALLRYFILVLAFAYFCAAGWQVWSPYS